MNDDRYEGFAERYDLSFGEFNEHDPQVIEFFDTLFSRNHVRTVLDCACGTGRHLLLFHNIGCEVWGSDASAAMLTQARKNLALYGVNARLQHADYRELPQHYDRSFDAVACLGSIGFMTDETQFLLAFGSMLSVLREGGILILTTIPTDKQWKEKPRFKLAMNTPDVTRLFVMDYLQRTVHYHIVDIFHSQEVNDLKVWSAELTVLLRDEQKRLLKSAGFRHVDFFGAFDFSPYHREESDRLITVAQR